MNADFLLTRMFFVTRIFFYKKNVFRDKYEILETRASLVMRTIL